MGYTRRGSQIWWKDEIITGQIIRVAIQATRELDPGMGKKGKQRFTVWRGTCRVKEGARNTQSSRGISRKGGEKSGKSMKEEK